MSGGGSNGAWEVGVLWGLLHNGNPSDFEWDYVTGISAGSINTAGLVGWAIGDELNATEWLSNTFNDLHDSDIWREYPEGIAKSVFGRPSLLDDTPALETLKSLLSEPQYSEGFKRPFTIAAENVETGEYTLFNQNNITFGDELAAAALSSSSIPTVFPPRFFKDKYFMDGGTTWNVNVASAIQGCLDMVGGDQTKVTVDILICSASDKPEYQTDTGSVLENLLRRRAIRQYYSGRDAIQTQVRSFPNVNWRYLFEEENSVGGMAELTFDPKVTWPLQLQGRDLALRALAYGPGFGFDDLL